jgi:hypothetical protein
VDEQRSQIGITALRDAEQPGFAASCVLSGNQTEPGTEVACFGEAACVAERGDQRSRVQHSNPGDRRQPSRSSIVARQFNELAVEGFILCIEVLPFGARLAR